MATPQPECLTNIRVNTGQGPRLTKVIRLAQTDKAIVYIPLNAISRIDYDRLITMAEENDHCDLLTAMRDERLNNGRNALVVYQDIIRSQPLEDAKPSEPPKAQTQQKPATARKKPGPKPGFKKKPAAKRPPKKSPDVERTDQVPPRTQDIEFPDVD